MASERWVLALRSSYGWRSTLRLRQPKKEGSTGKSDWSALGPSGFVVPVGDRQARRSYPARRRTIIIGGCSYDNCPRWHRTIYRPTALALRSEEHTSELQSLR